MHKNVPAKVYEEMKASGSKGIYFNQHIKGKFEFEKAGISYRNFCFLIN